jgi:hypothetical protein
MSKHERWALGADMRGATEDVAGKGRMSTLRIEKSFGHQYTSAVYIIAEGGDGMGQTLNTQMTLRVLQPCCCFWPISGERRIHERPAPR